MADPQNSQGAIPPQLQQLLGMASATPQSGVDPIQSILGALQPIQEQVVGTMGEGRKYMGASEAELATKRAQQAQAMQAQAQVGPREFQPSFKGRSTLGKIGEGLLTLGASTGIGRGIEDVIYAKPREEYARNAATIKALQDSIKGTTESMASESGMTSKPLGAFGTAERGAGILESAQARMQQVQNSLKVAMRGLDIKNILVGAQKGELQAKAALEKALPDIYRQRIALGYDGNQVKEDLANVLAQEGVMDKFQLSTLIDSVLGTAISPQAPQTQRGVQPEAGAKPMPQKRGGGPSTGGGTKPAYQKNGKWYDATTNQEIK